MKRKKMIICVIALLVVGLLVSGSLCLRLRNSVRVKSSVEYPVNREQASYRQDDNKWEGDTLGESYYTMKSSGCLVTCIAAALSGQGEVITPGRLNKLFSEKNVYDDQGNIQWQSLEELEGYHVNLFDRPSNEEIEACLRDGHFPIVCVRMHGLGSFHYVLVIGSEKGDYLCMDPLADKLTKLSAYGSRIYRVRCVWKEPAVYQVSSGQEITLSGTVEKIRASKGGWEELNLTCYILKLSQPIYIQSSKESAAGTGPEELQQVWELQLSPNNRKVKGLVGEKVVSVRGELFCPLTSYYIRDYALLIKG